MHHRLDDARPPLIPRGVALGHQVSATVRRGLCCRFDTRDDMMTARRCFVGLQVLYTTMGCARSMPMLLNRNSADAS